MRSSIMLVPALLARFGRARLDDDVTGCTLGAREIDPHIDVFLAFGAEVERGRGTLAVRSHRRLMAADHWPDYASVTTTENFVLCAALARGRSRLVNAASEPHVQEFCAFLAAMGARIAGSGSSTLRGRRHRRSSAAPSTPSPTTSTRSRPSSRSAPSPAAASR